MGKGAWKIRIEKNKDDVRLNEEKDGEMKKMLESFIKEDEKNRRK